MVRQPVLRELARPVDNDRVWEVPVNNSDIAAILRRMQHPDASDIVHSGTVAAHPILVAAKPTPNQTAAGPLSVIVALLLATSSSSETSTIEDAEPLILTGRPPPHATADEPELKKTELCSPHRVTVQPLGRSLLLPVWFVALENPSTAAAA